MANNLITQLYFDSFGYYYYKKTKYHPTWDSLNPD